MQFRALADQAAADGAITADEILSLRRAAWPDGRIAPEEAEAIFVLNDHIAEPTPEWADFFVETMTEFVINGREPRGYVDQDTADWLMGRIDHDGRLDSMAEMELLVRILEKAANAPDALKTYAQVQVERAVVFGTGPTRDGGTLDAGCISANECKLLRRLIFAAGGDGPAHVSRAEAEMLFRIKDATLNAANASEWENLFVQGVGNHLQAWHGKGPLSRDRAAELEIFMNDRTSHVGQFFSRMGRGRTSELGSNMRSLLGRRVDGARHDAEVKAAGEVTDGETLWLSAQIDADGKLDGMEQALLKFLRTA